MSSKEMVRTLSGAKILEVLLDPDSFGCFLLDGFKRKQDAERASHLE